MKASNETKPISIGIVTLGNSGMVSLATDGMTRLPLATPFLLVSEMPLLITEVTLA